MKKNKIITTTVLCTTLAFSAITTGFAAETPVSNPQNIVNVEVTTKNEQAAYFYGISATIKEIAEDKSSITVKQGEDKMDITLNLSEETVLLDNKTGNPMTVNDFKVGDKVYAYHSAAMTRSIPPQTACFALIKNVEENKAPGFMIDVAEIREKTEDKVKVLSKDGGYEITVLKESPISPYKTKQIVTIDDIKVGSRLFVWFDIATLSYPAQATSLRTVVIPAAEEPKPETGEKEVSLSTVKINGVTVDLKGEKLFVENGKAMVPVRTIAEALGFKVEWTKESPNQIALDDKTVKTVIEIGKDSYYKASSKAMGLTAPFQYGVAPMVVNGVTYAPAEMFNLLYSNEDSVKILGDTIEINNK